MKCLALVSLSLWMSVWRMKEYKVKERKTNMVEK